MDNLQQHSDKPTFDKVWLMFQETRELLDKKFLETDKKFQDTNEILDKRFQETQKEMRDRDKAFDKKMRQLEILFKGQWGKLVESLVEGDLIKLLNAEGVMVHDTTLRMKGYLDGREYEYDIVAENGKEVVVVEVKSTLSVEDVDRFLESLAKFKEVKEKYSDNTIYGAVAYLHLSGEADKYSYRKGLFVIRATGNSAQIMNDEKFKPKSW